MLIRPAKPEDLDALVALEQSAGSAAHWSRSEYEKLLTGADRLVLVAEREHQVAAFIVAHAVAEDWEIENVVVQANARRKGIASALVWTVLESTRADGQGRVYLEVRESNQPARRLYQAAGFREVGRRKGYYRDPVEDALLLECNISGAARKGD